MNNRKQKNKRGKNPRESIVQVIKPQIKKGEFKHGSKIIHLTSDQQ